MIDYSRVISLCVWSEGLVLGSRYQPLPAVVTADQHRAITCNITGTSRPLPAAQHRSVHRRMPVLTLAPLRVLCRRLTGAARAESIWRRERRKPDADVVCHHTRSVAFWDPSLPLTTTFGFCLSGLHFQQYSMQDFACSEWIKLSLSFLGPSGAFRCKKYYAFTV